MKESELRNMISESIKRNLNEMQEDEMLDRISRALVEHLNLIKFEWHKNLGVDVPCEMMKQACLNAAEMLNCPNAE